MIIIASDGVGITRITHERPKPFDLFRDDNETIQQPLHIMHVFCGRPQRKLIQRTTELLCALHGLLFPRYTVSTPRAFVISVFESTKCWSSRFSERKVRFIVVLNPHGRDVPETRHFAYKWNTENFARWSRPGRALQNTSVENSICLSKRALNNGIIIGLSRDEGPQKSREADEMQTLRFRSVLWLSNSRLHSGIVEVFYFYDRYWLDLLLFELLLEFFSVILSVPNRTHSLLWWILVSPTIHQFTTRRSRPPGGSWNRLFV